MKFLFHIELPHTISCAVLDQGGDVLKHVHACPKLVGVHCKHAHIADIEHFVEIFNSSLKLFPDNPMISCCVAARMHMTGATLPDGATLCAAATDDCQLDGNACPRS